MENEGLLTERVDRTLRSLRLRPAFDEYEIHGAVAEALEAAGLDYVHEAPLGPRCRADFLIGGSVVVEIKRGRPAVSALRRQLERYLVFPQVTAAFVLTEKRVGLPARIAGKPCRTLSLSELWGIAL